MVNYHFNQLKNEHRCGFWCKTFCGTIFAHVRYAKKACFGLLQNWQL